MSVADNNRRTNTMRTVRTKIFKFSELSQDIQKKVIEKMWDINVDSDWSHWTIQEFKKEVKDFDIDNVYFSGFSSQGDGAMFEYSAISDDFKFKIINGLNSLPYWKKKILANYSSISASGKQRGNYFHEKSVSHEFYMDADNGAQNYTNISNFISEYAQEIEEMIVMEYETLCKRLYRELESEYDSLISESAVIETIEANEYEFSQNGSIYHS